MTAFSQAISGLSPDAQLILALCIFTVILVVAVSPDAKRNLCDFLNALARFVVALVRVHRPERKSPQKPPKPPTQDAA
jgi:hypothetical protein